MVKNRDIHDEDENTNALNLCGKYKCLSKISIPIILLEILDTRNLSVK